MTLTNGLHFNVSRADYDAIERVNWSRLRHMKRSPAHYRAALLQKTEDTDAMRLGRATHAAALEPEKFRRQWAVWDGGARRGKAWEAFEAKSAADGLEVLTADQFETCQAIAQAALSDEYSAPYLRGGAAEVTLLWDYTDETGARIPCKARPDFAARDVAALVDLKTTRDASPEEFSKACWRLDYATQAAWYVDGYEAVTGEQVPFVIVAVESCAPHIVQVYRLPERLLSLGRAQYRAHLAQLEACRRTGRWPGYAEGPMDLELPRWAAREDDEDVTGLGLVVTQ